MPGDLEDFLKRAAQRREQNANRQQQQQPAQRPAARPEYTDSRRERQVGPVDDEEEVFVAELAPSRPQAPTRPVTPPRPTPSTIARPVPMETNPLPPAQPVESPVFPAASDVFAKRAESVFDHNVGKLDTSPQFAGIQPAKENVASVAHPIVELFRNPQNIAQAVMMREILDRPTDRWK